MHGSPPYTVAVGRKRRDDMGSVEDERLLLREQRHALEHLKLQLADRIASVEEREQELRALLRDARQGTLPESVALSLGTDRDAVLATRSAALDRREHTLRQREQALDARATTAAATYDGASDDPAQAARSADLRDRELAVTRREQELVEREATAAPADPDASRLAHIETRLTELREAEQAFLRTRRELAERSEAITMRERLLAQRERELVERSGPPSPSPQATAAMEARLRRLERQQADSTAVTQQIGFSGGVRQLQEKGTRRTS